MKKRNGRPPYVKDDRESKLVTAAALMGTPHAVIASILGIAPMTLKKHFKEELKKSKQEAILNVATSLYQLALKGNVTAAIFYLKTQAGWQENNTDDPSRPLPVVKYAERK